jgi:hypothetical protein
MTPKWSPKEDERNRFNRQQASKASVRSAAGRPAGVCVCHLDRRPRGLLKGFLDASQPASQPYSGPASHTAIQRAEVVAAAPFPLLLLFSSSSSSPAFVRNATDAATFAYLPRRRRFVAPSGISLIPVGSCYL